MVNVPTRAIEVIEALRPRVRQRRAAYERIDERIDAQSVPEASFRCEHCGVVKSRFAVGGLAESESGNQVWCLECVERRQESNRRDGRRLGGVRRE